MVTSSRIGLGGSAAAEPTRGQIILVLIAGLLRPDLGREHESRCYEPRPLRPGVLGIMRLLNAATLQLEEFAANRIPPYAILSHTWGEAEVLFTDVDMPQARNKEGYRKIQYTCQQAFQDGYSYVWIDTCCTIQTQQL